MLIAGEASGDLHASHLMADLKKVDPESNFVFLGGDKMTKVAGTDPVVHINEMAYMGFSEVLRNLGKIRNNLKKAKYTLENERPDALILIDYPSFNLKVAKKAKRLGIPVYYYISPKVWAWKEYRVKTIKKLIDGMFVIFPFEVDFYRDRHDMKVMYVGNPSVAEVDKAMKQVPTRTEFLAKYRLRDKNIIALLPGSRKGEIKNNLKVMTAAVDRFPQFMGIIAGAPGIPEDFYRQFTELPVIYDDTITLLAHSRMALVTSGTATLEAALVGTPQVGCYRSNGSKLAYKLMKRILKVPYVTLPNLIANRVVIPEKLLHDCTPDTLFEELTKISGDTPERVAMLDGYAEIRKTLSPEDNNVPNPTATHIYQTLSHPL